MSVEPVQNVTVIHTMMQSTWRDDDDGHHEDEEGQDNVRHAHIHEHTRSSWPGRPL